MRYLDIESLLEDADLVLTAEGGIDLQTPRGKIPAEVAVLPVEQAPAALARLVR